MHQHVQANDRLPQQNELVPISIEMKPKTQAQDTEWEKWEADSLISSPVRATIRFEG